LGCERIRSRHAELATWRRRALPVVAQPYELGVVDHQIGGMELDQGLLFN
jgi:hypothetical protein